MDLLVLLLVSICSTSKTISLDRAQSFVNLLQTEPEQNLLSGRYNGVDEVLVLLRQLWLAVAVVVAVAVVAVVVPSPMVRYCEAPEHAP